MPASCWALACELDAVSTIFSWGFLWQLGSRASWKCYHQLKLIQCYFYECLVVHMGNSGFSQNQQFFGWTHNMNDPYSKDFIFSESLLLQEPNSISQTKKA